MIIKAEKINKTQYTLITDTLNAFGKFKSINSIDLGTLKGT